MTVYKNCPSPCVRVVLAIGGLGAVLATGGFAVPKAPGASGPATVRVQLPDLYTGPAPLTAALKSHQAHGLALAAGDFDEDGTPDLVSGYAVAGGGLLTLHRGNPDALYPNTPAAWWRRANGQATTLPFFTPAPVFALPIAPDFIGAGDFDADGHLDIVVAQRGRPALYWLRGDGKGGFAAPQRLDLPGPVTAMTTGEINQADGLADIVVGENGGAGPEVLVFEGPQGAVRSAPEAIPLPAPATDLALGQLDDDPAQDLAIAAGNTLVIVQGRDRKLSLSAAQRAGVPPPDVAQIAFASDISSLAVGQFTPAGPLPGDPAAPFHQEIAVATRDGKVAIAGLMGGKWGLAGQAPLPGAPTTRLIGARLSGSPADDLLTLDASHPQLRLLLDRTPAAGIATKAAPVSRAVTTLPLPGAPVALLPMRLTTSALQSLVVLQSGQSAPTVLLTNPAAVQTGGPVAMDVSGPGGPGGSIVVNSPGDQDDGDTTDGVCDTGNATRGFTGICTLRAAIETANANGGGTITFAPAVTRIAIGPVLPRCTVPLTIDGSTNGGLVELDGTNASGGDTIFDPIGIALYGGSSTLRGMNIHNFGTAVDINLQGGNVVEGNFIGTDVTGASIPAGRKQGGILVFTANNQIGGTTTAARNLISGNQYGVQLAGSGATNNTVQGNYIGLDAIGVHALGNTFFGVECSDSMNNTIGGTTAGAGNVVAASTSTSGGTEGGCGISVATRNAPGSNNLIQGNYIGTDPSGTVALGNGSFGVIILGTNNTVGGTTPAARNIIAGNLGGGVSISFAGNVLQGNYIGTDVTGTQPLGNHGVGVSWGQQTATVGGAIPAAGNVVAANLGDGLDLSGPNSLVQNNRIGVDVNGAQPLGNQGSGVVVGLGTNGSQILNNVISANGGHGINIAGAFGGPANIVIQGNVIGTDSGATRSLGNGLDGIHVADAASQTIGGTTPGQGNVIAGSGQNGIWIVGGNQSQTHVNGNFIGTDPTGTRNLGNGAAGVFISGFEFIGGLNAGEGNLIAFNNKGIAFLSQNTVISSNAIYNNTAIGIDFNNDGQTPNTPGNVNRNLSYPTLASVSSANGNLTIQGNYNPGFLGTFRLEFFASSNGDPSGFGQGQRYLGFGTVTTTGAGSANFSITLPATVFGGQVITATGAHTDGTTTSEFSPWLQLGVTNAVDVTPMVQVTRAGFRYNRATGHFVQTVTLTNTGSFTLAGPVSLALDNLSANASLANKTGMTQQLTPAGSPYITVTAIDLAPGASASVTLEFADPSRTAITYTTRVLAGPGSR